MSAACSEANGGGGKSAQGSKKGVSNIRRLSDGAEFQIPAHAAVISFRSVAITAVTIPDTGGPTMMDEGQAAPQGQS